MTGRKQGTAGPVLDALAAHLTARGLAEHGDFFIRGRLPDTLPDSEIVSIREQPDGSYKVWYRDMGSNQLPLETSDFHAASECFEREAVALARVRGRVVAEA